MKADEARRRSLRVLDQKEIETRRKDDEAQARWLAERPKLIDDLEMRARKEIADTVAKGGGSAYISASPSLREFVAARLRVDGYRVEMDDDRGHDKDLGHYEFNGLKIFWGN